MTASRRYLDAPSRRVVLSKRLAAASTWEARKRRARTLLGDLSALIAISAALCAQEPDGWIRTYEGGTGDGLERPVGIVTDAEGAVYVSGSSGWGTATVKYDAEGKLLWETTTPGASALGMALDATGRLLVGKSGTDPGVIVRYDETGAETGIAPVNGEFLGMSFAASGDLYVISLSSSRLVTTKYNAGYERLWSKGFDLERVRSEVFRASALAVDREGNPHVAGTFHVCTPACGRGYTALKYGSDGAILWSTREAPVHRSFVVAAMALDPRGRCIVLGHVDTCGANGAGLALVQYDSEGTEVWTACHEPVLQGSVSAVAVATDTLGNVYVTGAGCGTEGCSYVTLRYDPDGNLLWEAELPGGRPSALAVDPRGAVIITGTELACEGPGCATAYVTVKYSAGGRELWVRRYGAPPGEEASAGGVAIDATGGVHVAGTVARDYGVVGYDQAGGEIWSATHNTTTQRDDVPVGVQPIGEAGVYVVSNSCDPEGCDTVVLRYDRIGRLVWERRRDDARATAMTVDHAGNLCVTGAGVGSRGSWVVQYGPDGTRRWSAPLDDPNPAEIGVDLERNVYVAGGRDGRVLTKYDADGLEAWSARSVSRRLLRMEVDARGYVYLAQTGSPGATIALFDQSGNEIWQVLFADSGRGEVQEIEVDATGNVYATGYIVNCNPECRAARLTVKYDLDGDEIWSARVPDLDVSSSAAALRADPAGNAYVGYLACVRGVCDLVIAKYQPDGAEAWRARRDEFAHDPRWPARIELDAAGELFVHGLTRATLKYSRDGDALWSVRLRELSGTSFAIGPDRMYFAGSLGGDAVILQHVRDAFFSEVSGDSAPVDLTVVAPELELPPEEGQVTHTWNFGAEEVVGESAEHTYDRAGNVEVELISAGRSFSVRKTRSFHVACPGGDVTPWTSAEIGVIGFRGATRLENVAGANELHICSGGTDIGGSEDSLHFVYQKVDGDVLFESRVSILGDGQGRVGLLLRESLEPGSRYVSMLLDLLRAGPRYRLRHRDEAGERSRSAGSTRVERPSIWLRLRRQGDAFIGSSSVDGLEWSEVARVALDLPDTLLAGFGAARIVPPPRTVVDPINALFDHFALDVQRPFRRGDANADGDVNLPDATAILGALFGGEAVAIGCEKAGDVDDSGALGITDAVYLLAHLFQSGPAPAEPADACGVDPTPDALSCVTYEVCP